MLSVHAVGAPYGAVHDVVKRILRGDEARVGDRPNKGSRRWYKHIWADCCRRPVMYPGTLLFQDSRLLVSGRLTARLRGILGRDAGISAGK